MENLSSMAEGSGSGRRRVDYFYDSTLGLFNYGEGHPMRPHRVRLTHELVVNYNLYKHMNVFRPKMASRADLNAFHSDEYVAFLKNVTTETMDQYPDAVDRYNLSADCPVFDGLYEYCQTYVGGSLSGAARINQKTSDIVLNWSGGMHHAKKAEASGFCYINDIVLAILELLKVHMRVLYIDIDIHHGDGVEEAFYSTERVMTVSFHKYGDYFFPGTGDVKDVGVKNGKYYSVNVPLKTGITDDSYQKIFVPVMQKVMEMYRPGALVLQCGADSLAGDRLGCFNLSERGHSEAVRHMLGYNLPTLVLGGGGYTIRNVARCWTAETAVVLGEQIADDLPYNDYNEYYAPDFSLNVTPNASMENSNTRQYLDSIKQQVHENLRMLQGAPGVAMEQLPPNLELPPEPEADPDARGGGGSSSAPQHPAEHYDDD